MSPNKQTISSSQQNMSAISAPNKEKNNASMMYWLFASSAVS